jgi:hypothetical protein
LIDSKVVAPDALAPSMVNEVMSLSISIEKKHVEAQPTEQYMNKAPKKSRKSTKKK